MAKAKETWRRYNSGGPGLLIPSRVPVCSTSGQEASHILFLSNRGARVEGRDSRKKEGGEGEENSKGMKVVQASRPPGLQALQMSYKGVEGMFQVHLLPAQTHPR